MSHPGNSAWSEPGPCVAEKDAPLAQPPVGVAEKLGLLAQQLRDYTDAATLSFVAIKAGGVGLQGATSASLGHSLAGIRDLVDRCLAEVRLAAGATPRRDTVALDTFIAELGLAAGVDASTHGCELVVHPVAADLRVEVDRPMLDAAVSILLQNAFRFTRPRSSVWLEVRAAGDRVLIDVEDQCGGFPAARGSPGRCASHGLSIVRRAIEANGGTLALHDMPGTGCRFTIELPAASDQGLRTRRT